MNTAVFRILVLTVEKHWLSRGLVYDFGFESTHIETRYFSSFERAAKHAEVYGCQLKETSLPGCFYGASRTFQDQFYGSYFYAVRAREVDVE